MLDICCVHHMSMVNVGVFSVSVDIAASLPADGGTGRTEHPRHHLGQEEQDPRVLPVLAQDEDLQN